VPKSAAIRRHVNSSRIALQSRGNFRDQGRITYDFATDAEALDAFQRLSRTEGIIPALESAHAIAHVLKVAPQMRGDEILIANLSGRGDKDVAQAAEILLRG